MALAALGIAAALGAGRRARRLHRRRPRHHGGQAGRDRSCAASTRPWRSRSRRARASATASGTCRRTSWWSAISRACGSTPVRPRRRVLGWSQAELLGRTSEWIEHPDDIARSRAELAHLAAGGITQRFENRLRHKDGTYRWLSWTAVVARRADLCHGARRHRREGGRRDAAAHRGGAAPVAEDGGRRPAHRRHRPRFQQSAARHRRIARPGAEAPRRRPPERDPALSSMAP